MEEAVDLIAKQDFEQARILLENIVARESENQEALKNLGLCYLNLEDFNSSEKIFSKLLKLNKEDASALFYLANSQEKIGKIDEAIKNYKKVIKLRDEFFDAYKNLCVLYVTQGEFSKAQKLSLKGIEKNSSDYQFYYFLSTTLVAQGNTKKAIEYLKKALALKPDHEQLLNNLGSCYLSINDWKSAQETFEKAFDLNPKNPLTNYNLGTVFQFKGEYKRALNYFNESYKSQPTIMILTSLAQCAVLAEDFALGAKLYRNLVALHPEKLNFKRNLLTCLIETRNIHQATSVAQELLKLNPKAEDIKLKLAILYRLSGQNYNAITILEELIRRGKIEAEIYYEHGLNAIQLDDMDAAKNSLKKVIQLEPDNALAHKDLGLIYLHMNLADWAEDEIKTALKLEPDNHYINFAYATFLNKTNGFTDADIYYKKAIELYPKSADYLTYYAQNLMLLGKIDEAVSTLKNALEIDSEFLHARFELAKIYFSQKKYEVAKKLLEDLTESDVETVNLAAKIEMKLKNFEEAKRLFEKLYEIYPKNHLIITDLANCYLNLGDNERAKEYARKALEIFSDFPDAMKILKELSDE